MEWFKLGLEAVKVVCDANRQSQVAEANRERDKYKMQADNLAFQLDHLKNERKNSGNGIKKENHRRNTQSQQGTGNYHSTGERKCNSKFSSPNHKDGRKPSVGQGSYGQDSSFAKQRSNTIHNGFGLSKESEWKTKPNTANFGVNRRGSFQSTGRGRGRGRSNVKF